MTTSAGSDGVHRFGRRAFLARLGLGAGALALGGSAADAFVRPVTAAAARSRFASTDAAHFGRLFPELQPFAVANQGVTKALLALGAQGGPLDARDDLSAGRVRLITDPSLSVNNPDNPTHTAGTTFVGQFIDHDVTFDASSTLGTPTDPLTSPTARTPALDLDSVYGAGPFGSPMLYDTANDPAKLLISSGGVSTTEKTSIRFKPSSRRATSSEQTATSGRPAARSTRPTTLAARRRASIHGRRPASAASWAATFGGSGGSPTRASEQATGAFSPALPTTWASEVTAGHGRDA